MGGGALLSIAALLILLRLVVSYPVVVIAHGRGLIPERLAGRGVTFVNAAQMGGAALLPVAAGFIIGAFPPVAEGAGSAPEEAYRLTFAFLAGTLALGLAAYTGAPEVGPQDEGGEGEGAR